jgi:hypothetical protein
MCRVHKPPLISKPSPLFYEQEALFHTMVCEKGLLAHKKVGMTHIHDG